MINSCCLSCIDIKIYYIHVYSEVTVNDHGPLCLQNHLIFRSFDSIHTWFKNASWVIESPVDSAKYKCKQPPTLIMLWDACDHISIQLPDKDIAGKCIVDAGCGGQFGKNPPGCTALPHSGPTSG